MAEPAEQIIPGRAPTVLEFLTKHSPYGLMDEGHLEYLEEHLRVRDYAEGETIIQSEAGEADRLYIVRAGAVLWEPGMPDQHSADAYWVISQGDGFPLNALLEKSPVAGNYRALEPSTCIELRAEHFNHLVEVSAPFRDWSLRHAASVREQSKRISQMRMSRAEQNPLNIPLSTLMRREPVTCGPGTPMREALRIMHEHDVGSLVVVEGGKRPVGILTTHDLLVSIAIEETNLALPVRAFMKTVLVTRPPHARAYEAALDMARYGIRHIVVIENDGLVGIVSERDLFTLQQSSLRLITTSIRKATSLTDLVAIAPDIRGLAQTMLLQGVAAEQLTGFISALNDMLVQRILDFEFAGSDLGGIEWCWIALGSEGRLEQTLSTDQDNGIIFVAPTGVAPESVRQRLLPIAQRVNETLARCGFPLCRGEIMAGNPKWLMSLDEWKQTFASWIHRAAAPELLNATIFFDFRPVYGAVRLTQELREHLNVKIKENRLFLRRMVENALGNEPPLGVFRDFVTTDAEGEPHTMDLKVNGAALFVDAARVFALSTGISESNTPRRLRAAGRKWNLEEGQVEAWIDAFFFLQLLRLRNHSRQLMDGRPTSNRMDPESLNDLDRRILKESFRQAKKMQGLMEKYFQF
jgi:CBS domain-containing protein